MTTWLHGTQGDFEVFSADFIGVGNDQIGSGFYFTDNYDTALGYTRGDGVVLTAEPGVSNPMETGYQMARDQIARLIEAAPDFEDTLMNFGDIAYEGRDVVLRNAVSAYASMVPDGPDEDIVHLMNALSNDFWDGAEADFLRKVFEVTGKDGLVRKAGEEMHLVAWLPERIQVLSREQVTSPAP